MNEPKGPLSRWSERKAAARRGDDVDREEGAPAAGDETPAIEPEAEADAETPVLPSIDTLDAQSDYTVFFGKKVPEALRRAALRKLWTSDPVLANLDGLNDYDDDYNLVEQVITLAQSSLQSGIGYGEEVESKLKQIDQATGATGSADSHDERTDEDAAAAKPALRDNDAAACESSDATRPAAAGTSDPASNEPAKEPKNK